MGVVRPARALALTLLTLAACANLDGLAGGSNDATLIPDGGASDSPANGPDSPAPVTKDGGNEAAVDSGDSGALDPLDLGDEVKVLLGQLGGVGYHDGVGADARFDGVTAITRDALSGNLYVADANGTLLRKIATSTVTTLAGSYHQSKKFDGVGSSARFSNITSLAYDSKRVYVAESSACAIRAVDPVSTQVISFFTGGCVGSWIPRAIRYNPGDGLLYIAAAGRLFSWIPGSASEPTVVCGSGLSGGPNGLVKVGDCNLAAFNLADFVVSATSSQKLYGRNLAGEILTIDLKDKKVSIGSSSGGGGSGIENLDEQSLLFGSLERLVKGSLAGGSPAVIAGGSEPTSVDGPLLSAGFEDIRGLQSDLSGGFFITDHSTIRRMSNGSISTVAGRARSYAYLDDKSALAKMGPASAIATDGNKTIFFLDYTNHAIRAFDRTTDQVKTVLAEKAGPDTPNLGTGAGPLVFDGTNLVLFEPSSTSSVFIIDPKTGATRTQALSEPYRGGAAVDGTGRIFVVRGDSIAAFKVGDAPTKVVDLPEGKDLAGICFDKTLGVLFMVDELGSIFRIDPTTSEVAPISSKSSAPQPGGIACDNGFVYLFDGSLVLRVNSATGETTAVAGSTTQTVVVPGPLPASLNTPVAPVLIDAKHLLLGSANESLLVSVPIP